MKRLAWLHEQFLEFVLCVEDLVWVLIDALQVRQDFRMAGVWICHTFLKSGLDMFTGLSICAELDVCNLGFFICKMVCVNLELVSYLYKPSLKGRVLPISEYRWIWDLGGLGC